MISFEWDPNKDAINRKKHGITFEEAATAFLDEQALIYCDPDHSVDEERYILLGVSRNRNLLVVVHCTRDEEKIIRIISARCATKLEVENYVSNEGRWS